MVSERFAKQLRILMHIPQLIPRLWHSQRFAVFNQLMRAFALLDVERELRGLLALRFENQIVCPNTIPIRLNIHLAYLDFRVLILLFRVLFSVC